MKSKHSLLAVQIHAALIAAAIGLSPAAFAQESDKAKQEDQALEVIMVTAQKRVQSTQEVPISVATLSGEKFDAIFAASDTIAIGAMRALRDRGFDIPTDVAIIGFDDIPAASLTHPPLTTIQQDYRLAGEVLVDGVLKQIRNEQVPTAVLPAKLIVRKSCGSH